MTHTKLDKIRIDKIRKVKNFQNKTVMQIGKESNLPLEAICITLKQYKYTINY